MPIRYSAGQQIDSERGAMAAYEMKRVWEEIYREAGKGDCNNPETKRDDS
jgi:hypothetical protein